MKSVHENVHYTLGMRVLQTFPVLRSSMSMPPVGGAYSPYLCTPRPRVQVGQKVEEKTALVQLTEHIYIT